MQKCVVDQCDRDMRNKTHQLCDPHYKRLWRTGDVQAHIPLQEPRERPRPVVDYDDGTRECQACAKRLPLTSFHSDAKSPKGRRKSCKKCRTAVETARYWEDPESVKVRVRAHRLANPELIREREAARYERDKPKRIALAVEGSHRRRARMYGRATERGITVPALRRRDGDECCYCGVTLIFASFSRGNRPDEQATLEHVIPISRGGTHTWDNAALACWRDNIAKGAATEGWEIRPGHRLAKQMA